MRVSRLRLLVYVPAVYIRITTAASPFGLIQELFAADGYRSLPACAQQCISDSALFAAGVCRTGTCLCAPGTQAKALDYTESCSSRSCDSNAVAENARGVLLRFCGSLGLTDSGADSNSNPTSTAGDGRVVSDFSSNPRPGDPNPGTPASNPPASSKDTENSLDASDSNEKNSLGTGEVIGIVLGILGLLVAIMAIFQARRYIKAQAQARAVETKIAEAAPAAAPAVDANRGVELEANRALQVNRAEVEGNGVFELEGHRAYISSH